MNENDRASGRGGTGCVGGSKNLKAVVIKAEKKMAKGSRPRGMEGSPHQGPGEIMDERVITSPRKGGLSVYGTNVLMNMTNVIGGLPTFNSRQASFREDAESDQRRICQRAHPGGQSHLPCLPGRLQEGSRDQRRPLEGHAHGELRVRIGLGFWRKLWQ